MTGKAIVALLTARAEGRDDDATKIQRAEYLRHLQRQERAILKFEKEHGK